MDVTFESGVTKVGYGAFYKCYALQSIEIPTSMKKLAKKAFGYDEKIDDIYYRGTNFLSNLSWDSYNDYITKDGYKHYTLHKNWSAKYADKDNKTVPLTDSRLYNIVTPGCELTDGVWVVRRNIDLGGATLEVTGNVILVLLDNCGIKTSGGIHVHPDKTLTVVSEHIDTSANNTMGYIKVPSAPRECAGIGGWSRESNINIVICGGNIEVCGGDNGADIGGGNDGSATVTVYNGVVKACGDHSDSGIGSGFSGDATVIINGGDILARAGSKSGGIGGGFSGKATVTVNDGHIVAYGNYGAGIGSGQDGNVTVYINGGDIEAYGGDSGAGIGSGREGHSTVTIKDGNIKAQGGDYAAGIGSGKGEGRVEKTVSSCTINLYGGNITAIAGIEAEDIGAGKTGKATINDYRNSQGSVLSAGNLWIILVVAVVVLGIVAAVVVVKKKKKPAASDE